MTNSSILNNTASNFLGGGGIYNRLGTVNVTNSTLSGNSGSYGGGIYNDFDFGNTLTVANSIISGNTAKIGGGGVYNEDTLIVTNNIVSGNVTTNGWGGGIYNNGGSTMVTVTNSTLSGNVAQGGGGIYNDNSGKITLNNSIVWGNSAPTNPQIENIATLTVQNSAIQNFGAVNVTTNNGGNMSPGSSADIFVGAGIRQQCTDNNGGLSPQRYQYCYQSGQKQPDSCEHNHRY